MSGDAVEVWNAYIGAWTHGFTVEQRAAVDGAYTLRRSSDGAVLPGVFTPDRVRPASRGSERGPHLVGDLEVVALGDDHGGGRRAG